MRRIFEWRREGRSATWIVKRLNSEGVPGPTGGVWRISTISGSRKRRNGILNNELYAGRIVFNRQRFVRDPVTRKRVSRPNPESEWKVQDVPELRIVDEATWAAVAALESAPERIAGVRRVPSKRLLSGLIRCGTCGGSFTVVGAERWGCSTARSAGTCANTRTISTPRLEDRVLGALRERLLQPDLVAAFVEEYRREREAQRVVAEKARQRVVAKRAKVTGRIERITDMMADGIGDYAEMKSRLATALAERAEIDRVAEDADVSPAVAMHPNLAEAYRRNIVRITEALNAPGMEAGDARQALRNLVELITAEPRAEGRGLDLVVHGRLAQILHIANDRPDVSQDGRMRNVVAGARTSAKHKSGTPEGDCMIEMVAGAGFEPATFRL